MVSDSTITGDSKLRTATKIIKKKRVSALLPNSGRRARSLSLLFHPSMEISLALTRQMRLPGEIVPTDVLPSYQPIPVFS